MKFTRLRVLGFKSFVEPTEFVIEPGLTGVVGPNGCGKSNLVEALRWVMGESSYKAMRERASKDYKVESTPTLFINGKVQKGGASIDEMDKLIQPFLKS